MKNIMLIILVCSVTIPVFGQTNFYQVALTNVAGNPISLSGFSGKKLFITVCSAANPDTKRLKTLDSLSRSNPSAALIVIPVQDFDGAPAIGSTLNQLNASLKKALQDSLQFSFNVAAVATGKKNSGSQQPLLAWLTNKNSNSHFDYDLSNAWQTFVVNEHGTLFAVLEGTNDLFTNYSVLISDHVVE